MIVCMSRRICIDLYRELIRLRRDWHHEDDDKGRIKVVMTGGVSDPPEWQPHIRNKLRREALAERFREVGDPLQIVLVRDMWLTGFDAPSLHTMYIDKPMRGHGLMQAIARANRVIRDKPGLGRGLPRAGARAETSSRDLHRQRRHGEDRPGSGGSSGELCWRSTRSAAAMFHGFDYSRWVDGTPAERVGLLPAAQEHILAQEHGKERCLQAVRELSRAFAPAVPHEDAIRIREDVAFFQAVRSVLAKRVGGAARAEEELDYAVRQIVSRAVASEGVVDIFAAAGLDKPDISILSDEFLAEVRGMKQRNLSGRAAAEAVEGGTGCPQAKECRPGALLCRDA